MTQEALSSLKALGNQLRVQLLESPEFRALTVVERTIQELSEIMGAVAPAPDLAAPAAAEEPSSEASVAAPSDPFAIVPSDKPRIETIPPGATSTQSRMAKAIAEAIAAKTTPFGAPVAAASSFARILDQAS